MDFAQDFLTQLISGFELGFAFYVVGSFISFSMCRAASEPKQSEPMQITTLASQPALQPLDPASKETIAPLPTLSFRQLKERAKTANLPRYSRMSKSQLLQALQLT